MLTSYERAGFNAAQANRGRMARTGLTNAGQPLWTEGELADLRARWPDIATLLVRLPRRTETAIRQKAQRSGLTASRRVWIEPEVGRMRKPYIDGEPVVEILPLLVEKTRRQVYSKASQRRYRRPRRRPVLLGHPLKDSIRQRAFDMNISLAELDRECRAGGCFGRKKALQWQAVSRALKMLAGTAVVRWPAA